MLVAKRENGECAGWQGANFTNGYRPKAFTAPPSSCNNNAARLNVSNDDGNVLCSRAPVSMGAVGASAPMLFKVMGPSTLTF